MLLVLAKYNKLQRIISVDLHDMGTTHACEHGEEHQEGEANPKQNHRYKDEC